jgi:hypothetical protein
VLILALMSGAYQCWPRTAVQGISERVFADSSRTAQELILTLEDYDGAREGLDAMPRPQKHEL